MSDELRINENFHKEGLFGDASESLLIRNNELYKNVRSKSWHTSFQSHDKNMQYKVGCEDGKRFVQYTQHNVQEVADRCKRQRELHQNGIEPWKAIFPFAKYPAMELPKAIFYEISSKYFDNRPWDLIKRDPVDKAKFYMVVNQEYPQFVIHPSGKIPIPISVPYPKARNS